MHYFLNKKELQFKCKKPALKRVFLFKINQINQSISSSIHSLEQG